MLVAHSLGCLTAAAWAAHSKNTHLVKAALLVAPPDTDRGDIAQLLPGWKLGTREQPLQPLPFESTLYASNNDPFCSLARAQHLATAWGSKWVDMGPRGHINAESGLGDWPEAHAELLRMLN